MSSQVNSREESTDLLDDIAPPDLERTDAQAHRAQAREGISVRDERAHVVLVLIEEEGANVHRAIN